MGGECGLKHVRWVSVVGYAVVVLVGAVVLLEHSEHHGVDHVTVIDIDNKNMPRTVVTSKTRVSQQDITPGARGHDLPHSTSSSHCLVAEQLETEANLLLQTGPNGSAVFSELDGTRQHFELARHALAIAQRAHITSDVVTAVTGHEQTTLADASNGNGKFSQVTPSLCRFLLGLVGRGPCAASHASDVPDVPAQRVIVFGGSMTFGTEPMKKVRRSCPGCPHASTMKTAKGRIYGDAPHCCSWPRFVDRWFSAAAANGSVLHARAEVVNLAVPASSTAWLAPQVLHILSSLPGGPATACDLVLIDYSVNDADAKVLYHDNETGLASALAMVVAKVAPAPVIVLQTYPHGVRQDRWGKRAPDSGFDYRRAYQSAAAAGGAVLLDISSLLEETSRVSESSTAVAHHGLHTWPHPPWELHAVISRLICAHVVRMVMKLAACNGTVCDDSVQRDAATPTGLITSSSSSLNSSLTNDCDTRDAMWADAKAAMARNGKVRGFAITLGTAWSLYEDVAGKPGWIFESDQHVAINDSNSVASTGTGPRAAFQLGLEWAPWLAYGLRPVSCSLQCDSKNRLCFAHLAYGRFFFVLH